MVCSTDIRVYTLNENFVPHLPTELTDRVEWIHFYTTADVVQVYEVIYFYTRLYTTWQVGGARRVHMCMCTSSSISFHLFSKRIFLNGSFVRCERDDCRSEEYSFPSGATGTVPILHGPGLRTQATVRIVQNTELIQ